VAVVSVSIPDALLAEADAIIKARGYAGRSDFMRAALRDFAARQAREAARDVPRSATLTLVYPEGQERSIAEIRHHHAEIVKSMMHAHTATDCVEVFILQGRGSRLQEFVDRLRRHREAKLVEAVYTDAGR
jgi:CopG family nickel-responsive transcriptional regulator